MYCIHCGVKLQEASGECPLCHTPVVTTPMPESAVRSRYSDRYPEPEKGRGRLLAAWLITAVMIAAGLSCLIVCLQTKHAADWSGFVLMSLAVSWVWVILPLMFPRWRPMVFLPLDFLALGGFLVHMRQNRRKLVPELRISGHRDRGDGDGYGCGADALYYPGTVPADEPAGDLHRAELYAD